MTFNITKEEIEKKLGFKVENIQLKPMFKNGECIGLYVYVKPQTAIEYIDMDLVIIKDGCEINEDNVIKPICPKCGGNVEVANDGYYCQNNCGYEMII